MTDKIDFFKNDIVKLTPEQKAAYRTPGHPADIDDAFVEALEDAAKKLKEKNLDKDKFEK